MIKEYKGSVAYRGMREELPRAALFKRHWFNLIRSPVIGTVIGAFGLNNSVDDLFVMFAFGIVGYVMRKYGIPVAPAILALVQGDLAELSLRRALLLFLGDPLILVSRPISAMLLAGAAVSIAYPLIRRPRMVEGV